MNESFGDRLRLLLKNRTVRAVSRDWGVPVTTLNNYFTKNSNPSLEIAYKIAKAENVSMEWLAKGNEYTKTDTVVCQNEVALIRIFRKLSEQQKSAMVTNLAKKAILKMITEEIK